MDHEALAREIHMGNIAAGWWPENRNRGEIMMLMVSELAEAGEGRIADLWDDRLPDLKMFDVELADFAIRTYDLIGADAPTCMMVQHRDPGRFPPSIRESLFIIVCKVVDAMEAHRKGRVTEYQTALWKCLSEVYALAARYGVDLPAVIERKRAYNAQRPDHKLENRMAEGGKKY